MISPTSSALAALGAAGTKMANSAHNVANSNTDGYKKSRVVLQEDATGGVSANVGKVPATSQPVEMQPNTNLVEHSNVEYGEEIVDQMTASNLYKANLKTFEAVDEMLESALNLKA